MPVRIIEAFRKASTGDRFAKWAYPTVPAARERQRNARAKHA
jgi:hypothetical protein